MGPGAVPASCHLADWKHTGASTVPNWAFSPTGDCTRASAMVPAYTALQLAYWVALGLH